LANSPGRRFNLLDAMILVAAAAFGIAAGRAQVSSSQVPGAWWGVDVHNGGVWFAFIWAVALILVQFRAGSHERRRLTCRPGFTACLVVVASLAVLLVHELALKLFMWARWGRPLRFESADLTDRLFGLLSMNVPCAVAATWVVLALGGRWRPGRDWVDRLGLLLGVYWLAWPVLAWVVALGA
jgi:hypothetical protein